MKSPTFGAFAISLRGAEPHQIAGAAGIHGLLPLTSLATAYGQSQFIASFSVYFALLLVRWEWQPGGFIRYLGTLPPR